MDCGLLKRTPDTSTAHFFEGARACSCVDFLFQVFRLCICLLRDLCASADDPHANIISVGRPRQLLHSDPGMYCIQEPTLTPSLSSHIDISNQF